ncbi:hypothetical protein Y5S_01549 [Alcanivorax nanhaiticus]|uniref:Uncharacterized protein n=1 Tax=Alcanivorax nanhaiticus TaxID=1177154 RepID=A0A095URK5_9GAMM|nr:hypothetical protein [Alcanivorax nanhaiticus]KGD65115.1 hypothetical protein Y5S_01549 [Alcanivorax nanhaiticus]
MTVATLLLLPLLAGYAFSVSWAGSRYNCAREDGYRLYFRAAFYGCFLLTSSFLIHLLLIAYNIEPSTTIIKSICSAIPGLTYEDHKTELQYLFLSATSLVIGSTLGHTLNLIPGFKKFLLLQAIRNHDLELLMLRAVQKLMAISFTMGNGKIYVGFIVTSVDPAAQGTAVRILPLMSGFRDKDSGKAEFTTFYDLMYEHISNGNAAHLSPEDFEIVLPLNEIQSANLFDTDAYELFKNEEETENKNSAPPDLKDYAEDESSTTEERQPETRSPLIVYWINLVSFIKSLFSKHK